MKNVNVSMVINMSEKNVYIALDRSH